MEDEERIGEYIKKGLEMKSFSVDLVQDGESGLDMAISEEYEVIILDRMLPELDGMEVCRRLRAEGVETPVLMLTARTQVEDRVEGLECGADDYLGKPFEFGELVARVRALLRRPKINVGVKLQVGSLELNTNNGEVKRAGKKVVLTRKEFALLEFLMRHKGRVFDKEQLTEKVWSFDSDVLPNTAQVYMGYLRNKIDRAFPRETPLLHTVRGFGYKMEEKDV